MTTFRLFHGLALVTLASLGACQLADSSLEELLVTAATVANTPAPGWCAEGQRRPTFADDSGVPSVDIFLAQAPLFSNLKSVGQKLKYLGLFHTALIFSQALPDGTRRNWTVEFAAVGNVLNSIVPKVMGNELHWNSDARYCATEGTLWGQDHWTHAFRNLTRVTGQQVDRLFTEFVLPLNKTDSTSKPFYQLWKVVNKHHPETVIVKDITCGDGAIWLLDYMFKHLAVPVPPGIHIETTQVKIPAAGVEVVDTSNPAEWANVIAYFLKFNELVAANRSAIHRASTLRNLLPMRYLYDGNANNYLRVIQNSIPYLEAHCIKADIEGPPWLSTPAGDSEKFFV